MTNFFKWLNEFVNDPDGSERIKMPTPPEHEGDDVFSWDDYNYHIIKTPSGNKNMLTYRGEFVKIV